MENSIKYLNDNPWVGIIVGGIALITMIVIAIIGWLIDKRKQKHMYQNSPHIKADGKIVNKGNIIAGNSNVVNEIAAPEFHLQLYGSGAKKQFEGHIEKKSDQFLIVESIAIDGELTQLNQQFSKLFFLKNLSFPANLFTVKKRNISVKIIYRTLDGKIFEYSQKMSQQSRKDKLFNLSLMGSPVIKKYNN
jgi:hypothetical protein